MIAGGKVSVFARKVASINGKPTFPFFTNVTNINYQLYNLTNKSQIQKHMVGQSFKFSNSKSFGIGASRYQTRRHQLLLIWSLTLKLQPY